jgi:formylglycine-generating enzyme required for sulfatase activity
VTGTPGAVRLVEDVLVPDLSGEGGPPERIESPTLVEEPPTAFRDPIVGSTEPGPAMVWLPGGTFRMGSPEGVGEDDERPAPVRLRHYAIGRYPVTVGEFRRFVAASGYCTEAERGEGAYVWHNNKYVEKKDASWRNPYFKQADDHPVVCISWNDAKAYCDWLGEATGQRYGLLTEAEWENACRAGSAGLYCFGDDTEQLRDYAWYGGQVSGSTRPVGGKRANAWGLHDLHGNCWEWCEDWYADYDEANPGGSAVRDRSAARTGDPEVNAAAGPHSGPYAVTDTDTAQQPPIENPSGPATGSYRVIRGGAWNNTAAYCRSAYRNRIAPSNRLTDLGFRLSRTGPLSSYPVTRGAAPPTAITEPPAPRRFAPYEVFRDHLNSAAPVGAAAAGGAPEMVYLPGGVFQMGDAQGNANEQPVHPVELPAFALGRTPVTWGEYRRFCETTGTHWPEWRWGQEEDEHLNLPVVGVTWDDARAYCDWLSDQTGEHYTLPTEAQWEYACRAGTATRWSCGDDPAQLSEYAWFSENADGRLRSAGQRHANDWGLYDMHGNCWEWCADWYAKDYYQQVADVAPRTSNRGEQRPNGWQRIAKALGIGRSDTRLDVGVPQPLVCISPCGPETGSVRVVRGGAWYNTADGCRSAHRRSDYRDRGLGFRVSRTV